MILLPPIYERPLVNLNPVCGYRYHALATRKEPRHRTVAVPVVLQTESVRVVRFCSSQNCGESNFYFGHQETFYSEEELQNFYQNLLDSEAQVFNSAQQRKQSPDAPSTVFLTPPSLDVIETLEERFSNPIDVPPRIGLTDLLMSRLHASEVERAVPPSIASELPRHRRLLRRLTRVVESAEMWYQEPNRDADVPGPSSGITPRPRVPIPLALVSYKEWFEIVQYCVCPVIRVHC
jgi:hypothetical protein